MGDNGMIRIAAGRPGPTHNASLEFSVRADSESNGLLYSIGLQRPDMLLVRVAENRTGETWGTLRRYLERMQLGEFSGPAGRVLRPSEPTPQQKTFLKALGVHEPPQLLLVEPPARAVA